jgi:GTP-binding protein LepA
VEGAGGVSDQDRIRNFSIIAHIDHGKSTLADQILRQWGSLSGKDMLKDQVLDSMDLEREKGITIKASAVRLTYRGQDGREYLLNLIDTPGHVDFSYEVSRSLAACEGALLVIDASQGVEAQTLANLYLALENDLAIVPVVNKIDLPTAEPEKALEEIHDLLGLDPDDAVLASAKEGRGITEVLEAVIRHVPPPTGSSDRPLRALIMDAWYDEYQGVVVLVRVKDGALAVGDRLRFMAVGEEYLCQRLGVFLPSDRKVERLGCGEVGYLIAGIKNVGDAKIGDTVTHAARPAPEPLPGYRPVKPMVFCGLYPVEDTSYGELGDALKKLALNDPSFAFEPESSLALGFGFRCGYLGLLHMEIIQERLEREFNLSLIATAPTVRYQVEDEKGVVTEISNPLEFPTGRIRATVREPFVTVDIVTPVEYMSALIKLCQEKRGVQKKVDFVGHQRAIIIFEIPLAEMITDFFGRLKSLSRGYASLDYHFQGYREADMVRMDILINDEPVDALSVIVHKDAAQRVGRGLTRRLKEVIPRQMFAVPIQSAVGGKILARETVPAMRKNVLAKCYGGDITRKRKLLEKQKEGKRRMKQIGRVEVPQEAFMAVLKITEE